MHVAFVCHSLACGGVLRVISNMANYWAQKGWPVTVFTLYEEDLPPFFELDSRIRVISLKSYRPSQELPAAIETNLRSIYALRRAIRDSKPRVVICSLTFVNNMVLLATRGLGVPVIVSERTDPSSDPIRKASAWLRRWTYPFAAHLVVQTERAKAYFWPTVQAKTTVIPNPVTFIDQTGKASPDVMLAKPSLVAMGRFHRAKGFDILLRAFARLSDRHSKWTLTILGDGPLRTDIELLCDELGLGERVHLPGFVKNPHHVLQQADLFVLSSRSEGIPNALIEAMSCGLPVISTDCRSGPREIIRDGVDGMLVSPEDVEALADAMGRLISDESERNRLASRAVEVTERFSLAKVMGLWEELLSSFSKKANPASTFSLSTVDSSSRRS